MTLRRAAALLALALCASAGAQDLRECGGSPGLPAWVKTGTFQGTLGGRPVALALDRQQTDQAYFYTRYGVDISLTPFQSGNVLILQEEVWQGPGDGLKVTGCFTLRPSGTGLSGEWRRTVKAAPLPVRLTALNVAGVPLQNSSSPGLLKLRAENPLAFLKLNRPWAAAANGRSVREPVSGLSYPQVPGAGAGLRAALQDRLLENAENALDCRSRLGASDEDDGYELTATVTLNTPRLLSVREDVWYYCGGAHPDNYTLGLIFDRATGRPVAPGAIWKGLTPAQQKALYLAAFTPDPECRGVLNEMAPDFTANLSKRGLELTPTSLPHVVVACGETATVTYSRLRDEANPASPYFGEFYPR
jgi:hypothetical protein